MKKPTPRRFNISPERAEYLLHRLDEQELVIARIHRMCSIALGLTAPGAVVGEIGLHAAPNKPRVRRKT